LTVVRALVEMHGGTISAHSEGDDKGSEFTVRLPLTSEPAEADGHAESPSSGIPAGTTVVVVEDNADSLEMLCSVLKLAGATCHSARDGRSALTLIDQVSPQVVILDVGLPHLDGLEVARRIRANPRHAGIRLIALTGYGLPGDRQATAEAGFDCHLVKPVPPADLFQAMTASLPANAVRESPPTDAVGRARGTRGQR
jgi:CheY-like chemotaxis protein